MVENLRNLGADAEHRIKKKWPVAIGTGLLFGAVIFGGIACTERGTPEIVTKPPEITIPLSDADLVSWESDEYHIRIGLHPDYMRVSPVDGDAVFGFIRNHIINPSKKNLTGVYSWDWILIYRNQGISVDEAIKRFQNKEKENGTNISKPTRAKVDNHEAYRFVSGGNPTISYIFNDGDSVWTIKHVEYSNNNYSGYEKRAAEFDEMVSTFQVTEGK